jgi:acetate kinase
MPAILVINSGSSSLKAAIWQTAPSDCHATALAECLGTDEATLSWSQSGGTTHTVSLTGGSHPEALAALLNSWQEAGLLTDVEAVGHRIVHGGEAFQQASILDSASLAQIEAVSHLAPLHNPANLAGVRAAQQVLGALPHIGVFDTAFHQTMPATAYRYAIPSDWYHDHAVRKYGFHGTSHRWVAERGAECLGLSGHEHGLITAHLGNGCSITAVQNGNSVDTTMGLTPLAGTVMGTRSGSIDPGILAHVAAQTGQSLKDMTNDLNKRSGLLGLSGSSNDMRTLADASAAGDTDACLAIEVFCYRLAQEIMSMAAALPRLDGVIFTGGIGENAAAIRATVVTQLRLLGLELDTEANASHGRAQAGTISTTSSRAAVLVIQTNEELQIARETAELL